MKDINEILNHILQIEHGFKHIDDSAEKIMAMYSKQQCFELAQDLFQHEAYQIRMLSTKLLGLLAFENNDALCFLKEHVSVDKNWRMQEMLAKAFDEVCRNRGYESSLPLINEWMSNKNPNVVRAVTEGLRIWTSRSFFKENPSLAISLLSQHKSHESEYLRKSVGNALKDIRKKHKELVRNEIQHWDLSNPRILFTYKLAAKLLE